MNTRQKKMPESEPSPSELRAAVKDCFYAATQCATCHYWALLARPLLESDADLRALNMPLFMSNGIVEGTLMFFRKTHEFFKIQGARDEPDTLYAYRWTGFQNCGEVYPIGTVRELHKRVGHITVREARIGKVEWPMFPMAMVAFDRWIDFFKFLAESHYAGDAEMRNYCTTAKRGLERVKQRMENEVAAFEKQVSGNAPAR